MQVLTLWPLLLFCDHFFLYFFYPFFFQFYIYDLDYFYTSHLISSRNYIIYELTETMQKMDCFKFQEKYSIESEAINSV